MRGFRDALWGFILLCLVIFVFGITTTLCLEFFGVLTLPEEYSVMKFFDSKMEKVASLQEYAEATLQNKTLVEFLKESKEESVTVELDGNTVTVVQLENSQEAMAETENAGQNLNSNNSFKYYNQLDEYAKIMYDGLEQNKDKLKSGNHRLDFGTTFNDLLHEETGNDILNQSFQLAVNAFSFDHPEIFYIDITKIYLLTEITTRPFSKTYKVSIGPNEGSYLYDEYKTEEDVNLAIAQVNQVKDYIMQNSLGTTYDKIKYVHDYLLQTAEYEKTIETYNNYNIYGAMVNKKAVCEGYAKTFKYVLDELNIPCFIVCGTATNSSGEVESHAWNYVEIDNALYAVDVTWDDPIIIGEGRVSQDVNYKYFLRGANKFFEDHVEDGTIIESAKFIYPKLSNIDYK